MEHEIKIRTMSERKRRESGMVLIVAMVMLAVMGIVGVAALDTVSLDQQAAGYQSRKRVSFYAAEAGVAEGLATLRSNGTPTVTSTDLGDPAAYPHGQPGYALAAGTTIEKLGSSSMNGMAMNIDQGGAATYQVDYWRFEIAGQDASGTTSKVEVAAGRFTGY